MSEILRFETNQAQEVILAYAEGREVEGRYGPQLMYSLRAPHDHIMYVPATVGEQIRELGIKPGERIDVCRAEIKHGARKGVQWMVGRVDAPLPSPPLVTALPQANGAGEPPRMPAPPAAAPSSISMDDNNTNHSRSLTKMEDALKTVASALLAAEQHAKRIGYEGWPKQFNADEVVRLAATILINGARENANGNGRAH
jgi:hypothetical protein